MAYSIGSVVSVSGEPEYNSALKRIRDSMKNVNTQGQLLTSVFGKNEKSVASLTAKNKQLQTAQKLQKDVIDETQAAMERLKKENLEGTEAYKKLEDNLTKAQIAFNKTEREIEQTEQAMLDLKKQDLSESFDKAKTSAGSLTTTVKTGAVAFAALTAAVFGAATALVKFSSDQSDWADELLTLSVQTGISAQKLQEWSYAARFIDTEVEDMTKGLARLVMAMKTADNAGKDYLEIVNGVTVSMKDANGQYKSSEQIFYEVIDVIGSLESSTQREIAAQQIFGRSFLDMQPLIAAGSGALKEYGEEAHKVGAIVSDESVAALGKYNDALQVVKAQWEATKTNLAAAVANPMTKFADSLKSSMSNINAKLGTAKVQAALNKLADGAAKLMSKLIDLAVKAIPVVVDAVDWLVENGRTLVAILAAVVAGVVTFKAALTISSLITLVSTSVNMLGTATEAAAVKQVALNTAMNMNPIVAIISLVAALTTALIAYASIADRATTGTATVNKELRDLRGTMAETITTCKDNVDSIEAQELAGMALAAEMDELTSKTSLTAGEQARLDAVIKELNSNYKNLNLTYDASTGKLNKTRAAIMGTIKAENARAKLVALQDKWTAQSAELAEAKKTEAEAIQNATDVYAKYGMTAKEAYEFINGGAANKGGRGSTEVAAMVQDIQAANDAMTRSSEVLAEAQSNYDATGAEIDVYCGQVSEQITAEEEAVAAQQAQQESLEELQAAYDKASERVKYYADYTTDAFGRVSGDTAMSVSQMIENLQANQEAIAAWTNNLGILAESGLDAGFLQKLRDMGPEAAASVQSMVDYISSGGTFDELNELYRQGAEQANQAVMTELDTVPEQFMDLGENAGQALADGITLKIDDVYSAGYALGKAAIEGAQEATDTHSPSRKARYLGLMFDEGYAGGLAEGTGRLIEAARQAMTGMMTGFNMAGSYTLPTVAAQGAGGSTIVNLTVTNPSEAWLDYVFDKFDVRLAGVTA